MSNIRGNSDNDLLNWCDKIDGRLRKLLVFLLVSIIVLQLVFLNQTVRTFLSRTDKLEGKSVADSQLLIKKGEIEFTIENYDSTRYLTFYINGEKAPVKNGKRVLFQVKDNDVVEISGANFDDMAILRVTSVSDNVSVPELGKVVYINKNLVLVDRVRLK